MPPTTLFSHRSQTSLPNQEKTVEAERPFYSDFALSICCRLFFCSLSAIWKEESTSTPWPGPPTSPHRQRQAEILVFITRSFQSKYQTGRWICLSAEQCGPCRMVLRFLTPNGSAWALLTMHRPGLGADYLLSHSDVTTCILVVESL